MDQTIFFYFREKKYIFLAEIIAVAWMHGFLTAVNSHSAQKTTLKKK